ncbi:MAG: hypothetical protein V4735_01140 [Pseudomonadota bacterium]
MTLHRKKTSLFALVASVLLAASPACAANISTAPHKGYGRITFNFDQPAKLRMANSGTTAELVFDAPVSGSAAAIKAGLPGYVSNAALSADKKTVTLTLNKPYRMRQFVSGATVGIDLIGAATTTNAPEDLTKDATAQAPTPPPAPASTPVEKKPIAKPPVAVAVKKVEKPVTPPKPTAEKPAPAPDPMLSTKAVAEPAAAVPTHEATPVLTTKEEKPSADEHATAPTPPAPVAKAEEKPQAAPVAAAAEPAATAPAKAAKTEPFIVTMRTVNAETIMHFPWQARTAAAVFKRANHLWVVFSRAENVNVPLLRTVLPRQVVNITQYAYAGNTVLHLVTDGSVHARAVQQEGSYPWNVILSTTATAPTLDTPAASDNLDGQMRLVLGVFDVAPPVRFYDPDAGDLLVVIPTYENGRGVSNERNFPQFSILSSNQGVTLVGREDGLRTHTTRAGVIVEGEHGLALSANLPLIAGATAMPLAGASTNSGVMMPYEQWYVPPERYFDTLFERLRAVAAATPASKAQSLMELVKLYLEGGRAAEASGVLKLIARDHPDYYRDYKLALLSAVSNMMMLHYDLAYADLAAPELQTLDEAMLWREALALYAPPASSTQLLEHGGPQVATSDTAANPIAPGDQPAAAAPPPPATKPVFRFLKYNKPYIRFYPPRVRQYLAVIAADAYLADGQDEKALAAFDTLIPDDILGPVKLNAEYTLGMVAIKKGKQEQALEILDQLSKQTSDPYIAARARYSAAMARFKYGLQTSEQTTQAIQSVRMTWRSDGLERQMLVSLIDIYKITKRYADVLRTQQTLLNTFPNDQEALTISADMGELFANIFLDGLADDMPPLKALSLFYEFRELTPIGDRGDRIIQRLADRLAAFDLLDRATQLLEHQIQFRLSGEVRSQVGARLALLHLFNHRPQEALNVLEVTNYGNNSPELQNQRQQLTAEALTRLGKNEEALGTLFNDTTRPGALLRLDILWSMQDWPNVVNRAEDILNERPDLTQTLSPQETEVLLKLALGYSFQNDNTQLRYLRDYYSGLIPDTAYKQIFDFITNDTTPLDPEDFAMLAAQISRTEGFLDTFKAKIAAGKLSEAIQ